MHTHHRRIVLAFLFQLLLGACAPQPPSGALQQVRVEEVDLVFLMSFPLQVHAVVRGFLPDGCSFITDWDETREADRFLIALHAERRADVACTQAEVPFEENIPLDVYGLPAGDYLVEVNGVEARFSLDADNILPGLPEG